MRSFASLRMTREEWVGTTKKGWVGMTRKTWVRMTRGHGLRVRMTNTDGFRARTAKRERFKVGIRRREGIGVVLDVVKHLLDSFAPLYSKSGYQRSSNREGGQELAHPVPDRFSNLLFGQRGVNHQPAVGVGSGHIEVSFPDSTMKR